MAQTLEHIAQRDGSEARGGSPPGTDTGRSRTSLDRTSLLMPFAYALAVVMLLTAARWGFGLQVDKADWSLGGSSLSVSKIDQDTATLGQQIVSLQDRIQALEQKVGLTSPQVATQSAPQVATQSAPQVATQSSGPASGPPAPQSVPAQSGPAASPGLEATFASEKLASLFQPISGAKSPLAGKAGFIFIGNKKDDGSRSYLADSNMVGVAFSALQPGVNYKLSANLVLRETEPPNNGSYYTNIPAEGVIPQGTTVNLTAAPVEKQRASGLMQVWAPVKVVQ